MPYKSDHIKVLKVLATDLPKRTAMKTSDIVSKAFKSAEDGDRRVRNSYRMLRKYKHIEIADRGDYRLTQAGQTFYEKLAANGFKVPEAEKKAPAKKAEKKAPAKKAKPATTKKVAKAAPKKAAPKKAAPKKVETKKAAKPAPKVAPKVKAEVKAEAKSNGKSNGKPVEAKKADATEKPVEAKKADAKPSSAQLDF